MLRSTLQNSDKHFVSLQEERKSLELYLRIESQRFDSAFSWSVFIDPALDPEVTEVPPMIIQPFVENAIWHGLLRKDGERKLKVELLKKDDKLVCTIEDNGVGQAFQQPTSNSHRENYTSRGNKLVSDRLDALNTLHGINGKMSVIDLLDSNQQPCGTRVEIELNIG